jgi:hemerythrin-like domain-containing protein
VQPNEANSPRIFREYLEVTIMTNYIDRLQKEHTDFTKLLDLLEAQISLFRHGERPDYDLMLDVFYYMTNFPDRFHHPKEDLAFAMLAERDSNAKPVVEELARQHRVIAESGSRFLDNLNAALAGAMLKREAVEIPGLEYVAFYRSHMRMEESELFPLARTLLRDDDWARIGVAAESINDPLFGSQVEERYRTIHRQIARVAECGCAVG